MSASKKVAGDPDAECKQITNFLDLQIRNPIFSWQSVQILTKTD